MARVGYAGFSSREVARQIGYSAGTLYNVFGSYDRLIAAINTRTFELWTEWLQSRLDDGPADRLAALVEGYFSFAAENTNVWMAIYDHRLPSDMPLPEEYAERRGRLTELVVSEIAGLLPIAGQADAPRLARSLIATVHGHCTFALNGSFALMGEENPLELAVERVREAMRGAGADL
jgi:AcrR family transcriptional regulator